VRVRLRMNLRQALKSDLQPEHDRVDERMGALDLTNLADLDRFLQVHFSTWSALDAVGDEARHALETRVSSLDKDLATLGVPARPLPKITVHDHSILYMAYGSKMGTAVLRKRWLRATDPTVRLAQEFLTLPDDHHAWNRLCYTLSKEQSDTENAKTVLAGVRTIYALFSKSMASVGGEHFSQ